MIGTERFNALPRLSFELKQKRREVPVSFVK
jgi:hypothetical protein